MLQSRFPLCGRRLYGLSQYPFPVEKSGEGASWVNPLKYKADEAAIQAVPKARFWRGFCEEEMMIIFDLDGTLYKTHVTELPLLRRLCAARNLILTPQDEYYLLHTTARHLLARVAPDMPEAEILRFSEELRQGELIEVRAHGELFEGAAELIRELHSAGYILAICGMGEHDYIHAILEKCAIAPYFSYVYHRMEGKTKGEVMAMLLRDAGVTGEACVMLGDSATDRTAARENGVPFLGVSYGYGAAALADEDRLAADISELREMLFTYLKG